MVNTTAAARPTRTPMLLGAAVGAELGAAVTGAAVGAVVVVGANDRVGCGVEGEGVVGAAVVVGANDAVWYSIGGEGDADVHVSGRRRVMVITMIRET